MIKRVLIIKLWAIGDVIMATPMLNALNASVNGVRVFWVVDAKNYPLLANHPLIDEVVAIDTAAWRGQLRKGDIIGWLKTALQLASRMGALKCDAVINCHPDKWWTFVLCRARVRVGLYPFVAPSVAHLMYNKPLSRPINPGIHNSEHYLLATRSLGFADGKLDMSIAAAYAPQFADTASVVAVKDAQRRYIIVAPFSTAENRNWPPERYCLLIQWLVARYNVHVFLSAASNQREMAKELASNFDANSVSLRDSLSVSEYLDLFRTADLVISGDSSPMHIAAALGVPFVALFGATPVNERAPLVGRGTVVVKELFCSPCDRPYCSNPEFRACMKLIEVADVKAAVERIMIELAQK